jgi:signal peptidase I
MPPVEPRDVPSGPFDRLFEELGVPPPPSPSDGSSWHAAWGPPQRPEPRGPSYAFPENRPLPRFDDTPFATIALPAPSDTPYRPGMYEPPVARPPERRSLVRPAGRLVRELAETIVLALAIFLLVRSVVQNFQVDGKSMEPTLETGWYLLVNKSLYWEVNLETVGKFVPFVEPGHDPTRYLFRGPKRGDVVVFRQPGQPIGATERDFIKRIIGLPGEIVEVHDGTVFINGKPLHEPYIADKPNYDCPPRRVPAGHYWVLGDNRNNSSDSHAWGPVPKGNIIGNAWVIYWPFHRVGLVNNKHEVPDAAQPEPTIPVKQDVPLARNNVDCNVT